MTDSQNCSGSNTEKKLTYFFPMHSIGGGTPEDFTGKAGRLASRLTDQPGGRISILPADKPTCRAARRQA